MTAFTLQDLEAIVAARAASQDEQSYTRKLVSRGMPYAAKKLGEEAVETVLAAVSGEAPALIAESADLLYHLMVVLRLGDVPLDAVLTELERRTAQTGLQEKAARPKD
jgi:phosphoribosyl-ATP pyrophosphohydrolase